MSRNVLVDGYTLLVGSDVTPDVRAGSDEGLYHRDTRHLSELSATIEGTTLVTVGRDLPASNRRSMVTADLDSTINRVDERAHKRTDVALTVEQAVGEGVGLAGRLTVANYSTDPLSATLSVSVDADFADVFEVRGFSSRPDRNVTGRVDDGVLRYAHEYDAGGTTVRRTTAVGFDPQPSDLRPGRAAFDLDLAAGGSASVDLRVVPGVEDPAGAAGDGDQSAAGADDPTAVGGSPAAVVGDPGVLRVPAVETGCREYDRVFARAGEDLAALTTGTPEGPVALAGTPWFATVFGRDALIAAYQALPVAPELARGTLRHLAAHQGTTTDPWTEEAPGKVFHEMRNGELARRGLLPHDPYYGTVDATPLWIVLLGEWWRFTGGDALVEDLSESLSAALSWIEAVQADHADDPFVYYESSSSVGLEHKAWRDTPGSVQFPDGEEAETPIASVEVQAYVYRALREAATLSEAVFDDPDRAADLRGRAGDLADAFEATFWRPDREFYALAKAGDGRVVPTATSNVGHCLLTGVVPDERVPAVARRLRSADLFSGWGLRTMATGASGYSPLSYHLGSVWPHDTSLTALGLAREGCHGDAERLARAVLDASTQFDDARIPELFCGFDEDIAPKPYPASCVPQAWSAGAPFALLRAAFDLEPADDGVTIGHDPDLLDRTAIEPILEYWNE